MPSPNYKHLTYFQINLGTADENKNSKVCIIKILLDGGTSVSTVPKDILHESFRILKQKTNKLPTMTVTFNTTSIMELKLKLPE